MSKAEEPQGVFTWGHWAELALDYQHTCGKVTPSTQLFIPFPLNANSAPFGATRHCGVL